MCGICGVAGSNHGAEVQTILAAIRHRGPDSFDTFVSDDVALGGCRLAIVRASPAPLPVSDEQGSTRLLLNGEIYNYLEIAPELGLQGVEQLPDPESSVLLELIRQDGVQGLSRLKGMFAIIVTMPGIILLARDRLGIKPLFYAALATGDVVFASELKALLTQPSVSSELDEAALEEIAVFGYINSPDRTPFRAIRQVPPGCTVEIRGGVASSRRFAQLPLPESVARAHAEGLSESAGAVLGALRSSVATMLAHDGCEKGFHLSGGIDSSLLVALAGDGGDARPSTFTLADTDDSADSLAARSVARAVGADHHEFHVDLSDFLAELPHFVRHYESPIASDGVFGVFGGMAFHMLSRRASEHVRVGFTGEGADELFGGYFWPYTHPLGFADSLRARSRAQGAPDAVEAELDAFFPKPEEESSYRLGAMNLLMRGGLTNLHLWSVDRSCSAFGFEIRPPYLYDDVVDLALKLSVEIKVTRTETKRVLRAAAAPVFESLGLSSHLHREKVGMPAAVDHIAAQFRDHAARLVPREHLANHPRQGLVRSAVDAVMFDLFQLVFVQNRGVVPDGFAVDELYESGGYVDLYR